MGTGTAMTADEKRDRTTVAIDSLRDWASEHDITMELVLEVLKDSEGLSRQHDRAYPPFHTVVSWADITDANGIDWHVVVREGATNETILASLGAGSAAFSQLMADHGWSGGRAITTAAKPSKAGPKATAKPRRAGREDSEEGSPEGQQDTFKVLTIHKAITETGIPYYTAKGGKWKQHGARAWADSSQIEKLHGLYDFDNWELGEDPVDFSDLDVYAVVTLNAKGNPARVIDFTGDDVEDIDG